MTTYFIGFFAPLTRFDRFIPPDFTPLPVEQRHLTLLYLGYLPDPIGACIRLSSVRHTKLRLEFQGLQAFPNESKPRYLAAVPTLDSQMLLARLRDGLSQLFPNCEERYRTFRPHVSIAHTRKKASIDLYEAVLKAVKASRTMSESIIVDKLCLMSAREGVVRAVCCIDLC
ncbi:MAG: 2'-5' RNA ligase family protein [Thermofilaceae archaeon]